MLLESMLIKKNNCVQLYNDKHSPIIGHLFFEMLIIEWNVVNMFKEYKILILDFTIQGKKYSSICH